jgi:dimethylargininase
MNNQLVSMHRIAITRKPGINFSKGITNADLGLPDYIKASAQHTAYIAALEQCGLTVITLEADERFPDGCFVEDTAVVTPEIAVISRPGADTRRDEIISMEEQFARHRPVVHITAPGTLEGGDVFQTGTSVFIGIGNRTNEAGAAQLAAYLEPFGYACYFVPVKTVLHLKTGITPIGNNRLISIPELAGHPSFNPFEVITAAPEEHYAANCLLVNDTLIIPAGFPILKSILTEQGDHFIEVEMTEFEKMDGGLTCLSVLL